MKLKNFIQKLGEVHDVFDILPGEISHRDDIPVEEINVAPHGSVIARTT